MQRVKHRIRQAYGFTDEQILEHISEYGQQWAIEAYEMIMEDEDRYWQFMVSVMPLARTPMDKKFGKSLTRYAKDLRRSISKALVPWVEEKRIQAIRDRLSRPPESKVYDESGREFDINDPDWWKKEV
jgi:hypothetical protein